MANEPKYATEETVVEVVGAVRTELMAEITKLRESIEAAAKKSPAAPAPAEDAASKLLARIRQ